MKKLMEGQNFIRFEGLGKCPIHNCNLWGPEKPVTTVIFEADGKRVAYWEEKLIRVCVMCRGEKELYKKVMNETTQCK